MNQEIKMIAPSKDAFQNISAFKIPTSKNAFQNCYQKYVCLIKEMPADDY